MRRTWTILGDTALAVAAAVGALCIVVFVCGSLFGIRVVLFSTGSMDPTIPAGSAAVTREIPAAEIDVGDVVTVERSGKLPITHRVVTVAEVPDTAETRSIVMRGDANAVDDPFPYEVDEVGLVLFSVPGIAAAISSLRSPWVLAGTTIAATALVVFVCWPRRRSSVRDEHEGEDAAGSAKHAKPAKAVSCVALVVALVAVPVGGDDAHAAADDAAAEVIQGEIVRLVSIRDDSMDGLVPGAEAVWMVGVSAEAPTPGVVQIFLAGSGEPALGLRFDVTACAVRWDADDCAAQPTTLIADEVVPVDGRERSVFEIASDEQTWLRIAVRMPEATDADIAGQVDLRVRASGLGDDVSVGPDGGSLAATGDRVSWLLLPAAATALTAGLVLFARRRST
ncbi:signal peptidase [Microbacterium terrae]|uniref:Signal peptidase I n=1 Tax=Microbacterium terrae TaxID=69369 RepID=A0A0M2H8N1_9MICO|nr:signal peptidase I [Microbacterium terrae]KJL40494.1 hypothetical protein RS81_01578 [Microbacterium terrae]MBP1079181.1 signal peptidase [Microbacterium terrae]GLJ98582.1 hypothetical protein GCM10017594_17790 [Microbacterium terrae]